MKHFFLLLCLTVFCHHVKAQTLHPDVISTSGTSFNDGTSQLDWTMGEPVTATLTAGSDILTQGFHQPDLLITNIRASSEDASLKVYPNPTVHSVNVQLDKISKECTIELMSADGKLVFSKKMIMRVQ